MNPEISALLERYKAEDIAGDVPSVSLLNGKYLRSLVLAAGSRSVLELGTAHAYSTIHIASALAETSGTLDTVEFSAPAYEMAQRRIAEAGFSEVVRMHQGNALAYLESLDSEARFDAIFIDIQKKLTLQAFTLAWPHLRAGGWMVVDDVRKFAYKMEGFFEHLATAGIAYDLLDTDPDDSIMFLRKPA